MDSNKREQPKEPPEKALDRKIAQARRDAEQMAEPKSQEAALQRLDEHKP
ncbi:MAG: hypothetical protein ACYCW6_09725 [Candidatus Xenobia bacterium]